MANVYAVMAGSVWKLAVQVGDQVEEGQDILILESMKMEIPVAAETAGIVSKLLVQEGDFVNEGDIVAEIKE